MWRRSVGEWRNRSQRALQCWMRWKRWFRRRSFRTRWTTRCSRTWRRCPADQKEFPRSVPLPQSLRSFWLRRLPLWLRNPCREVREWHVSRTWSRRSQMDLTSRHYGMCSIWKVKLLIALQRKWWRQWQWRLKKEHLPLPVNYPKYPLLMWNRLLLFHLDPDTRRQDRSLVRKNWQLWVSE